MNTQTAQHTPTPWKVWPEHTTAITTHRTDATTCCVARALECKDAAFIVRAVNAHEELLQIVKDLRHRSFDSDFKGWDTKQLDAIIAKAEGR